MMVEATWGTEHTTRVGAGNETGGAGMAATRGTFSKYKEENKTPNLGLTLPHQMSLVSQQQAVISERPLLVQPWGMMFVTKAPQA